MESLVKCQKCGLDLERKMFHKNRSRENGLQIFCKECTILTVKAYRERKKNPSPPIQCAECHKRLLKKTIDNKCGDCRHREKMRAKYHKNPEYYRAKNLSWRTQRAAINREIENEELEILEKQIRLNKNEMLLLTRFSEEKRRLDSWSLNSKLFWNELARLEELELLKREQEDYILTEKGLEFLNNWHESQA